jgi:hypothetical protein
MIPLHPFAFDKDHLNISVESFIFGRFWVPVLSWKLVILTEVFSVPPGRSQD